MTPSASNNFQTPVEIAFDIEPQTNVTRGNIVENSKVGELRGALFLSKDGKVVVNDSDWDGFETSNFSYSSDNVLSVSGFDASGKIQIGDSVRMIQSDVSGYKYFYVIAVSASSITLEAGDDYTYTNNTLSEFSTSKLRSPSGHPIWFGTNDLLVKDDDGDTITGSGSFDWQWKIDGRIVTCQADGSFDTNSDATNFVQMQVPFSPGTNKLVIGENVTGRQLVAVGSADDKVYQIGNASSKTGGLDDYWMIERVDTAQVAGYNAFGMRGTVYATIID